jgi:hypothetical protein
MNEFDDDDGELKAKQSLLARQTDDDFLWLMNDKRGRRIIWSQLVRAKVFNSTFDTHGGRMNLNEGMRQHGLYLLGEINRLCPDLYAKVVAENNQPE